MIDPRASPFCLKSHAVYCLPYDVIQDGAEKAEERQKNLFQKVTPLIPQDTQDYELRHL